LEINASNFALRVVLSQLGNDDLLHFVGFYFHKFFPIKINYKIHDKYFLAIINVFKKWSHLLEGAQHEITMYFDDMNL
jgi:hypothetical protein